MENGLISALDMFRGTEWYALLFKMALATITAGAIGLERRRKRRPAGFRTHILVCVGAVLAMTTGMYIGEIFAGWSKLDVTRLGAQVINGIGFLGAGTIMVTKHQQVKGLTTAAGLWASACMGLAIGAGYFECAVLACVFIYATITVLNNVDKLFSAHSQNMNLNVIVKDTTCVRAVTDKLREMNIQIFDVEITNVKDLVTEAPNLIVEIRLPERGSHGVVITALAKVEGVIAAEEV